MGSYVFRWTVASIGIIVMVVFLFVATMAVYKPFARYQHRADATNNAKVAQINLKQYDALIEAEKRKAEIKHQNAIGQRKANEEVALKLTPLFVQYEMIEALKAVATSGTNNALVYIPTGANGVPLVSVTGQPQVYGGASSPSGDDDE
jgi:hypothetical protein